MASYNKPEADEFRELSVLPAVMPATRYYSLWNTYY